ncbi:MAG: hypothetical protein K6B52_02250 [Clostridiales bacterium]|nr:hypothetical protein [Clostridiales bacterium]
MKKTHINHFTVKEINLLASNPYVLKVTDSTVKFTESFKVMFYRRYKSGESADDIFESCGIPPIILGKSRIEGFCYVLNKKARQNLDFSDGCKNNYRHSTSDSKQTLEAQVKELQHQLAYTQQEVEFLKKLQMANMEAQKEWESKHQPK